MVYDYSRSDCDWDGLRDHLRDVPWEDIFKLGTLDTASEFCDHLRDVPLKDIFKLGSSDAATQFCE